MTRMRRTLCFISGLAAAAGIAFFPAVAAEPVVVDFEEYDADSEPDDLFVIEGTFTVVDDEGSKVLRLEPQPLSESGIIFGKSLKGAAEVTAQVKA